MDTHKPSTYHKIVKLSYNWFSTNEEGENSSVVEVGKNNVKMIGENLPKGPGDVLYYEILYENGSFKRIYNPNKVEFELVNSSGIEIAGRPPLVGLH